MKYRRKPVEIEAIRWTGDNLIEVLAFCPKAHYEHMSQMLVIKTLQGKMYVDEGDYIIKDLEAEFYPCRPSVFRAMYEEIDAV